MAEKSFNSASWEESFQQTIFEGIRLLTDDERRQLALLKQQGSDIIRQADEELSHARTLTPQKVTSHYRRMLKGAFPLANGTFARPRYDSANHLH